MNPTTFKLGALLLIYFVSAVFIVSPLIGAEKEKGPLAPGDWLGKDRAAWMDASKALDAHSLKGWYAGNGASNTFVQASIINTRTTAADAYATVGERQAYYDWVSWAVTSEPAFPRAIADIKFFHATAAITSRGLLGWVETPVSRSGMPGVTVTPAARDLAVDINKKLFRTNVGVLNNLVYKWKEPRSPSDPNATTKLSHMDFDLEMVDLEQATVELALSDKSVKPEAVEALNQVLMNAVKANPGMEEWNAWASEAGIKPANFRNIKWRTAIGRAMVYQFHGKTKAEYLAMMRPPAAAAGEEETRKKVEAKKAQQAIEAAQRNLEIARRAQAAQEAVQKARDAAAAAALARPIQPPPTFFPPLPPPQRPPPPPPPVIPPRLP